MVKMIATDLDGTLLTSDKKITAGTRRIFNECREQGIRIVFATARPWRAVRPYLQDIACDGVIFHNGSTVMADHAHLGTSYQIPVDRVQEIVARLIQDYPEKKISVEMNDTLYANFDVSYYWSYTDGITTDFSDLPPGAADKVIAEIDSEKEFSQIREILSENEYGQICEGQLCLMMHKSASKLNGIRSLCQHWGITLKDVIAFGDDHNDLEMIRECGLGIAMANGIHSVREVADYVADHNDREGVAQWIQRYSIMAR